MNRFDRLFWRSLMWSVIAIASPVAIGQGQISFRASVPARSTDWTTAVSISKFDPSLGTLQGIDLTVSGQVVGSADAENLGPGACTVLLNFRSTLTLMRPDNTVLVIAIPDQDFSDNLAAFDGSNDSAGASGVTHSGISAQQSVSVHSPPPASDLLLFTGPSGNPGDIVLPIGAQGTSSHTGSGNLYVHFTQVASAMVTVTYTYGATSQTYCFGDGSGNGGPDCPCGNSIPGNPAGCLNSTGHGGLLTSSGTPSISNDSFQLTAAQLPANVPGYFFQGTTLPGSHHSGSGGVVFGGGLLCLGGTIVRLGKFQNPAGGSSILPFAGDPPLSVQFHLHAGDERNYQVWYRDGHGPCGLPFNTTNGIRMHWLP